MACGILVVYANSPYGF